MKRKSFFRLLPLWLCTFIGCGKESCEPVRQTASVRFETGVAGKAYDPEENRLSDLNLYVFNERRQLEQHIYLKGADLHNSDGGYSHQISLLKGCRYSLYAFANTGWKLWFENIAELKAYRYFFAYPDDYRIGIPMAGMAEDVEIGESREIIVPMKRLMAKVSLRIDRSRLDRDVSMNVAHVTVGGCAKSVQVFGDSRITVPDEAFITGFSRTGSEVSGLNGNIGGGLSRDISLYLAENMQGNLLYGSVSYKDKYFPEGDPNADICSYVEIWFDYISETQHTIPGKSLVYRFYLGEDECNFDVRRNAHYNITVTPEGDGLQSEGWRIDKSNVTDIVQ